MNKKARKKEKNDNLLVLQLAIFSVVGILYFCAVWFLNRLVYNDYLYFCPKASIIIAAINGTLIIFSSFLINKNTIKWLKSNTKKTTIIFLCVGCCLLIPFLFFKNGTVADRHSIKKIDAFGNVSKIYNYESITKVELWVHRGIEYDITFDSGEVINIHSHELRLNSFSNGKNIVEFDKTISKYSKKEIYDSTYYATRFNMHWYLTDKESYEYFEEIFGKFR